MLKDNIDFTKSLIKGEMAQVIFEQMFIEMDTSIVIPFGYEHTATVLHQFQRGMNEQDRQDLKNVRNMPDFLLVSQEKKNALLVEVKYRRIKSEGEILKLAKEVYKRWPSCWFFLATLEGFYFGKCSKIMDNKGKISPLSINWVSKERQGQYLDLLKKFISAN